MRLLWIPHTRWSQGVRHRSRYLIEHLRTRSEVHVITWSEPETPQFRDFANPATHLRALVPGNKTEDGVVIHHLPRWCFHRIPFLLRQNQRFLQEAVRRIVRENDIETIVFGPSGYLVGYPPVDTSANLIFDYVDYLEEEILSEYLNRSDAVVCASRSLQLQVQRLGHEASYIPNGVDFERLSRADGERVRDRYAIGENLVISLIGLTCSPDLYFAKSLISIHREMPHARFLFVGKGPLYRNLRRTLKGLGKAATWTGWTPQAEVYDYFLASDIGLYPGADNPYFRAACPIKILEYVAAGTPVVSSPVEEISVLGLANVIEVDANPESFHAGIRNVLTLDDRDIHRTPPAWKEVSERFERALTAY